VTPGRLTTACRANQAARWWIGCQCHDGCGSRRRYRVRGKAPEPSRSVLTSAITGARPSASASGAATSRQLPCPPREPIEIDKSPAGPQLVVITHVHERPGSKAHRRYPGLRLSAGPRASARQQRRSPRADNTPWPRRVHGRGSDRRKRVRLDPPWFPVGRLGALAAGLIWLIAAVLEGLVDASMAVPVPARRGRSPSVVAASIRARLHERREAVEQPGPNRRIAGKQGPSVVVEPTGIEPVTSCLQSRRSPS
jgi:hypothetical protein